ncbi:hypothetical protein PHSY_006764 [Pseudozyma hubeiensis SY62]|uniref:Uncharacterized protein n=1 Tax=Pseudozyma hubeiensis (strain SY62) TaxID=1305764 RepID=R9PM12_PSEHS|nr:hypothetical protein PHSY_006764 [Pseudozyma hubeiensis SY62]GAC99165.1 hypothetical protein PHSY_006764 [Pseudozyma hubeiensis SY62]
MRGRDKSGDAAAEFAIVFSRPAQRYTAEGAPWEAHQGSEEAEMTGRTGMPKKATNDASFAQCGAETMAEQRDRGAHGCKTSTSRRHLMHTQCLQTAAWSECGRRERDSVIGKMAAKLARVAASLSTVETRNRFHCSRLHGQINLPDGEARTTVTAIRIRIHFATRSSFICKLISSAAGDASCVLYILKLRRIA